MFILLLFLLEIKSYNFLSQFFHKFDYSFIANNKNNINESFINKEEIKNNFQDNIINNNISIEQNLNKLNPNWITGFCDGEASFTISISSSTTNNNWIIRPSFSIHLHKKDIKILELIQFYFNGIGNINISKDSVIYRVRKLEDLLIINSHFINYPLQTSKFNNFYIFYKVINLMLKNHHLNNEGLLEIASLINKLNKPLSPLILSKIGILPLIELNLPSINKEPELDPWWITGFCDGESSFTYFKRKRITAKKEERLDFSPIFEVSQHKKDLYILNSILNFFKSGNIVSGGNTERSTPRVRITGIDNLKNRVIEHFSNYPLQSFKVFNYNVWVDIINTISLDSTWSKERENNLLALTEKLNK